jgi:hypothetical protein
MVSIIESIVKRQAANLDWFIRQCKRAKKIVMILSAINLLANCNRALLIDRSKIVQEERGYLMLYKGLGFSDECPQQLLTNYRTFGGTRRGIMPSDHSSHGLFAEKCPI